LLWKFILGDEMRIAIFGDIHGNSIALDAVLANIDQQGGVDGYWLLGDYAAIGHDSVGCLERLSQLEDAILIRGNTDRMLTQDFALGPSFDELLTEDLESAAASARLHVSFAWTLGQVMQAGWMDWLQALAPEHRRTLPDGTKLLLVHASPGTDSGDGLHPYSTEEDLNLLFSEDEASLIIVGHTHVAVDRQYQDKQLVNASSVSNPFPPDLDANYLILNADDKGYSIERRSVSYPREAVIRHLEERNHPGRAYIMAFMRGENAAGWQR
jgi:predicted phosphodiesterase